MIEVGVYVVAIRQQGVAGEWVIVGVQATERAAKGQAHSIASEKDGRVCGVFRLLGEYRSRVVVEEFDADWTPEPAAAAAGA